MTGPTHSNRNKITKDFLTWKQWAQDAGYHVTDNHTPSLVRAFTPEGAQMGEYNRRTKRGKLTIIVPSTTV